MVGRRFNHTSQVAIVTPTDHPKSACNRCVIEVFGGVFVLSCCFLDFLWEWGFCHRTESEIFLFSSATFLVGMCNQLNTVEEVYEITHTTQCSRWTQNATATKKKTTKKNMKHHGERTWIPESETRCPGEASISFAILTVQSFWLFSSFKSKTTTVRMRG